jgi:hypothetical protein
MLCDFGGADVVFTFANILLYLLFQQAVWLVIVTSYVTKTLINVISN